MVNSIINDDYMWKKFQFWAFTGMITLSLLGIGVIISDHYALQNHMDYSKEKNSYQDYKINQLVETIIDLSQITTKNTDAIENIKDNDRAEREEILRRFEKLEGKVFRGSSQTFKFNDDVYIPLTVTL